MNATNEPQTSFEFVADHSTTTQELERQLWEAVQACRKSSKLVFDLPGEPLWSAGRKSQKANNAVYELASGMNASRVRKVTVFKNRAGSVTVQAH